MLKIWGRMMAHVRDITLTGDAVNWFEDRGRRAVALKDFDATLMRKDPPFDREYFYATHLLEQGELHFRGVWEKKTKELNRSMDEGKKRYSSE